MARIWRENSNLLLRKWAMNGCRIPGTPLVVDFWKTKELPPRMMFFLTHLHADHTSGLSSSWPYKIHCTGLTGELLKKKFGIDPKLVVELPLEQPKLLHVVSPRSHNSVSITVTAIDANHCPGASMFLFEGYFGRILYTGDFRYSADMVMNPCLNNSRSVDILYLDNTYCDPSCLFPTREAAREEIVSMMESYSGSSVYIGLHNLGKEDLLVYLASRFQSYVSVSQDRMEVLKVLGMPNVFTCSTEEWIRVVPFHLLAKN